MATESPPPTSPKSPTEDLGLGLSATTLSDALPPSDDGPAMIQNIQSLQNPPDEHGGAPTTEEVEGSVSIDEEDEVEFLNALERDLYELTIQQAEIEWSRGRSEVVEIEGGGENAETGNLDANGNGDGSFDDEEGKSGLSATGSGKFNQGNNKRRVNYPMRPDAEDCAFYMKVGSCKFGQQCKFNHPPRRKNQGFKDRTNYREENSEKAGQIECKYYLSSGGCKYGNNCKYSHGLDKSSTSLSHEVNFLGLPLRPGEKECPYYMRNGSCKYGSNCRFHHPEPTSVVGADSSGCDNGGTLPSQFVSSPSASTWSSPRAFNKTSPFVPKPFSPVQDPPLLNPEWKGYQAPMHPPSLDKTLPVPPAFSMNNNVLMDIRFPPQHQNGMVATEEYPERPGEPECSFFMKTGDCKFKLNCKFHHPKNRLSKPKLNSYSLNDKGLPLRPDQPVCTYYHRYGICKFGPACKYDHPSQFAILQTPFDQPKVT